MLKDRKKVKRIIKTLRSAAKYGETIRFKNDHNSPNVFVVETGNGKDGPYSVLNSLYLYRQAQKGR